MNKVNLCLWSLVLCLAQLTNTATAATSITQFGITWTFDKNYTTGTFANGDYWVVGPVNVIMISPMSTNISGATRHGTMINPKSGNLATGYGAGQAAYQGFDSRLDGGGTYNATYNMGRPNGNDISASNPMIVQPGSSVVSSITREEVGSWPEKRMQILTVAVLTVVPSAPASGSFRPGYSGDDKTVRFNKSSLDYSKLGKLSLVGSNITPLVQGTGSHGTNDGNYQDDTLERMVERPWLDYSAGSSGSYLHPQYNLQPDGAWLAGQVSQIALALNSNYTNEQKEKLLIRFIQVGIDIYSIHQGTNVYPFSWVGNGQMGAGRKFPILFAGVMLNDANMKGIGNYGVEGAGYSNPGYIAFAEDEQTFYVTQYDIDHYAVVPNGSQTTRLSINDNIVTYYLNADIGLPEWGIFHANNPRYDTKDWGACYRYQIQWWGGFVLAAHIMDMKTLWKHDAFFDYVDRHISIDNGVQSPSWIGSMWSAYRANYGCVWTRTNSNDNYSNGSSGCDTNNPPPATNLPPNADAGDTENNGSQQVTLNGSGSSDSDGSITSYVWKEGSTQIATGVSPSVTLAVGTHTITLTVTDNGGLTDTDTVVITVEAPSAADTVPPFVLAVTATNRTIEVTFSETLDESSAINTANYSLSGGLVIDSIWPDMLLNRVTLYITSLHQDGSTYALTVTNVEDTAGNPMPQTIRNYTYTQGLVGHWAFDNSGGTTAADVSGHNNTGTLLNGAKLTANGEVNLVGGNDTVQIATTGLSASQGTVSLWAYQRNQPGNQSLFGHIASSSNRIQLYLNAGNLCLGLGNSSSTKTNIQLLSPETWYHIALTWDGTNYAVYVDGSAKATGTYTGLTQLNTLADFGNTGNTSSRNQGFNGLIDESRIYNRSLAAAEVNDLALAFLPIGDKTVAEGEQLTFSIRTKPDVTVALSNQNLPGSCSYASNTFTWTPNYNHSGTYEVEFTAPHGTSTDFERITFTVADTQQEASVGYWRFNEASGDVAYDSSATGNTAYLRNGLTWGQGKQNGAITFSVPNDAVEIQTTNLSPQHGTVAMWVYMDNKTQSRHYLFGHATSTMANRIQLYLKYGKLCLGLGNSHETRMDIQEFQLRQWYHIALTWNNGTYNVYVNGVHLAAGTYSGLTELTYYADIGNNGITNDKGFNGSIDDVMVYNRALNALEIVSLATN